MKSSISSTEKGDLFEEKIYDYFRLQIERDEFQVRKDRCRIYRKKGYYSKDRKKNITFDVSIEIWEKDAEEYSSVFLIECKHYKRKIPVDDIEEFISKAKQVTGLNCKAVFATNTEFQESTLNVAQANGVGLLRYLESAEVKWILRRSTSINSSANKEIALGGLTQKVFEYPGLDVFFYSSIGATTSLWDFLDDLLIQKLKISSHILNLRQAIAKNVPFIKKHVLENRSWQLLRTIGYSGGEVSLSKICDIEKRKSNLIVNLGITAPEDVPATRLGQITFDPLIIQIFDRDSNNKVARDRFTLSHELAHHLLGHGAYLISEMCDEEDILQSKTINSEDIKRLEFQANYFASALLMPQFYFKKKFIALLEDFDLHNRGRGPLFVDDQEVNKRTYIEITNYLKREFNVSRQAVTIRLEELQMIQFQTTKTSSTSFSMSQLKSDELDY